MYAYSNNNNSMNVLYVLHIWMYIYNTWCRKIKLCKYYNETTYHSNIFVYLSLVLRYMEVCNMYVCNMMYVWVGICMMCTCVCDSMHK